MKVIFNGKLLREEEILFSPANRAFSYGDGIFETMIVRRGTCSLLSLHYKRLTNGLRILGIVPPFRLQELEGFIWELSTQFKGSPVLRMRLQLWRKSGGLYTPESGEADFLLTAAEQKKPNYTKEKAAFSKTVHLHFSSFSSMKTMSALPYVLAGKEMKQRQLDELILTDAEGHVAEGSSSNLFWIKDGLWHTPHLQSGCIAGVMRTYLIGQLEEKQIPVQEVLVKKEELYEAEALIGCNVTGLYTIKRLEYHTYESGRELLSSFIQLPEL